MPPRRRPRSWLAGRLRSAAGAVQRLAGRVEPAGHLPPQAPSATPAAAPRRFGEPPRHWLDLVAAHAPGLLHDLDLDPSPTGNAEAGARDAGRGTSTGPVDADGADPVADGRFGDETIACGPGSVNGAGGRDSGASRDAGPSRWPAERRTGGPGRPSRAADQPDGTGIGATDPSDGGSCSSRPDATSSPTGSTGPDPSAGPTGPVGPDAAVGPVRPATRGTTTAADITTVDTTTLDTTAEAEPTRTTSHPPPDVHRASELDHDRGRTTGSSPARPTAEPIANGRDGSRDDWDGPPWPRKDQSGRRDSAPNTALSARLDAAAAGAVSYGGVAWPNRASVDASFTGATATGGGDTPTIDVTRVAGGDPWLALPGEPAPTGRPAARLDTGVGLAGCGRATGIDPPSPLVAARAADPWPALPDDSALWSVAGPALDTAQQTRLDREQAGD
ncbi:hypothetical protein AB0C06_21880 [Micromonospora inaquosa]|uniref:hypothetical protein n=1 Tax=Micromonospora inaquosa TaxID=2203716 RepID=UPI0033C0EEEE